MALFTSVQSGNFADGATWGGSAPTSSDTFLVATGHTVTVAADVTSAGGTVESLTGGGLINNAKLTMNGALTLGNGSTKDGCLTFGAGSEIVLNGVNLVLNNCRIRSNSTSSNWAKVTGTGGVARGSLYEAPKQDFVFSYVSFALAGNFVLTCGEIYGAAALTNQADISNIAIIGAADIFLCRGGWTPSTVVFKLNDSDIRDFTGSLALTGQDNTTGLREFKRNTVSIDNTSIAIRGAQVTASGWAVDGSVFNRVTVGSAALGSSTKPLIQKDIFIGTGRNADTGNVGPLGSVVGSELLDSYVFTPVGKANPHMAGAFSGGQALRNVFEIQGVEPNLVISGTVTHNGTAKIAHNLAIGSGALFNQVGNNTGSGTYNVEYNTVYTKNLEGYNSHHGLFLAENGNFAGTINIKGNLHAVKGGVTLARSCWDNDSTPQAINADHNNFYGLTSTPYESSLSVTGGTNDQLVDPQFVDDSRTLLEWGGHIGVGKTYADAVGELLRRNGYNPATKTQSATPSGVTPADLVAWVRAGFAPTNAALKDAGHDGVTIGAMEYVSSSHTYTIIQSMLAAISRSMSSNEGLESKVSVLSTSYVDWEAHMSTIEVTHQACKASISEYSEQVITIDTDLLAKVSSSYMVTQDARTKILGIGSGSLVKIELPSTGLDCVKVESTSSITVTNIGG